MRSLRSRLPKSENLIGDRFDHVLERMRLRWTSKSPSIVSFTTAATPTILLRRSIPSPPQSVTKSWSTSTHCGSWETLMLQLECLSLGSTGVGTFLTRSALWVAPTSAIRDDLYVVSELVFKAAPFVGSDFLLHIASSFSFLPLHTKPAFKIWRAPNGLHLC